MRNVHFDAVKGLCVLAVIGIHAFALQGADAASLPATILRQAINFPVFVFLGLAGYFVAQSAAAKRRFSVPTRLRRLLPAYLLASVLTALAFHRELLQGLRGLLELGLAGKGIGIGYYVIVLVQLTLLTPLMLHLRSDRAHLVVGIATVLLGQAWFYLCTWQAGTSALFRFPYAALPFFAWAPSYQLGLWLGLRSARAPQDAPGARGGRLRPLPLIWLAAVGIATLESLLLEAAGLGSVASQLQTGSKIASSLVLVWAIGQARTATERPLPGLPALGRASYFLYLYHLPVLKLIADRVDWGDHWLSEIVLATAATAALLWGLGVILTRLAGPRRASLWLGLETAGPDGAGLRARPGVPAAG